MIPELYPAIDLRGGHVVRLRQGDYGDETIYGDDPVAVAMSFVEQGARWIHVVDLDAARTGDPVNRAVIGAIASRLGQSACLQVGGGVRTLGDAQQLCDAGVTRVVMGSAAVSSPDLVADVSRIIDVAVGLDHRAGEIAVHGWTEQSGETVTAMLSRFPTAAAFVITDISRDGMLQGPDVEGLREAAEATNIPVIASGGVSSLDDVRMLREVRNLAGIITGKAIYDGRFTVAGALEVLR